jgi:hypothetical protein
LLHFLWFWDADPEDASSDDHLNSCKPKKSWFFFLRGSPLPLFLGLQGS